MTDAQTCPADGNQVIDGECEWCGEPPSSWVKSNDHDLLIGHGPFCREACQGGRVITGIALASVRRSDEHLWLVTPKSDEEVAVWLRS